MARAYSTIAFTDRVRALQRQHGSADAYASFLAPETPADDALGASEAEFISARDGFYQATISETEWPYLQFRGGAPGFVHVVDGKTLAYADFRGNRQYLSVGNLSGDDRIALFFMDYANQRRLKIFGHASVVDAEQNPEIVQSLHIPGYRATPERAIIIEVAGFDWNCPQHIPKRLNASELEIAIAPIRARLAELETENAALREKLSLNDAP